MALIRGGLLLLSPLVLLLSCGQSGAKPTTIENRLGQAAQIYSMLHYNGSWSPPPHRMLTVEPGQERDIFVIQPERIYQDERIYLSAVAENGGEPVCSWNLSWDELSSKQFRKLVVGEGCPQMPNPAPFNPTPLEQ